MSTQIDAPKGGELPPQRAGRPSLRLEFLDGLRGLAALYVVVFHLFNCDGLPRWATLCLLPLHMGHNAVTVFIALSGFSLMIPVVLSQDRALKGGTLGYLKRRAWRIMPPYYAALAVSLLVLAISPEGLAFVHGVRDREWMMNFSLLPLVSHLFLFHNLQLAWSNPINVPMWSVATEWQIYFVFPFLLLPLWRRFGNAVILGAALVIGLAPHLLFGLPTDVGPPWYITLFTFGMVAAVLCFSGQPHHREAGRKIPWLPAAGALCAAWLVCVVIHLSWDRYRWISELLIGGAVTCLIAAYARLLIQGTNRPLPLGLRLLSSRWATGLGTFSYSIYLIHFPVLYTADMLLRTWHASFPQRFTALFVGAVPLAVGLSYLFHLAFERRFMSEFARPSP